MARMVAHGGACKPSGKQHMYIWYMHMHDNLLQYSTTDTQTHTHTHALEVKTNRILTLSLSSKYDGPSASRFVPHRVTKLFSYNGLFTTFMSTALHVCSRNSVTSKKKERGKE